MRTWIAIDMGSPISTIFLIRSKIIPKERETTVKAAIEKSKGGNNSNNIHLSNNGTILNFLSSKLWNLVIKNRLLNIVINQMNYQDNFL